MYGTIRHNTAGSSHKPFNSVLNAGSSPRDIQHRKADRLAVSYKTKYDLDKKVIDLWCKRVVRSLQHEATRHVANNQTITQ